MALSTRTKRITEIALADRRASAELVAAVDANGSGPAAAIAAIKPTVDLTAAVVAATTFVATAGVYFAPGAPTGAEVNTVVDGALAKVKAVVDLKSDNADLETLRGEVETRLDTIETKIDAVIAALKAVGMMAP